MTDSSLRTPFALSIVARLPVPMLSIGLLVHTQRLTGSFAAAGAVVATFAAAGSVGGPVLARLIDAYGQARPLAAAAACSSVALLIVALVPASTPILFLAVLAGVAGLALPPVGACMRTLLPGLVDRSALQTAYAAEATATELTFVAGPPVVLLAAGATSSAAAIAAAACLLGVATIAFAMQSAARAWQPSSRERRGVAGALRARGMQTLVAAFLLVGLLFGAVEVGVAASGSSTAATGGLLGVWGVGSLLGGLVMTRLGHRRARAHQLTILLIALTVGHVSLAGATGSELALAGVLLVAGASISPMYATVNATVDRVAPNGMKTEAFAWLTTAAGTGAALGAAFTGVVAEELGAPAAFLLAGAAGALATAIVATRARTLSVAPVTRPLPNPTPGNAIVQARVLAW